MGQSKIIFGPSEILGRKVICGALNEKNHNAKCKTGFPKSQNVELLKFRKLKLRG